MSRQVFCPECFRTGQRSTFETDGTACGTAMGGSRSFYDEDGNQHYHEVNMSMSLWWCSNGHRFRRRSVPKCPSCDHGSESWELLPTEPAQPEPKYFTWEGTISIPAEPGGDL